MTSLSPTAVPPGASDALRLVLFGLAGSGKSSLLGALGRAGTAQEHLLRGKLEDRGHGLAALARKMADPPPGRLTPDVNTYPIRYIPVGTNPSAPSVEVEALLVDCDGREANDLLVQTDPLAVDSPEGSLAHELGDADGLILVLDATTPSNQVEGQFAEFARFLESVQRARGARAEVAGLPVFLVLNKCDRLAQPGDGAADWMERIEQRKRDLAVRFRAFLADREETHSPTPPPSAEEGAEAKPEELQETTSAFGRIELYVWATAVRRPTLAGSNDRSQEPYGVAELFRQALEEGSDYRQRCHHAQRRLFFVSAAAIAVVAVLLAITVGLFALHRSTQLTMLDSRVRDFQFLHQFGSKPGLSGSLDQLRLKKSRVEEIRDNTFYHELEPELREQVDATYSDLSAYITFLEKLLARRPPTSELTETGLDRSLEQLRAEEASLPEKWKDTPAAHLLHQRVASAVALGKAVQLARNWYLDAIDQADRLLQFTAYTIAADGSGIDWTEWTGQVEKLLSPQTRPPFRPNDPIPDLQGATLSYAAALRFDTAETARRRWLEARESLRRVLAVSAAVGLAVPMEFKAPPVLDFPVTFHLSTAKKRLTELKLIYPDFEKRFIRDELPPRCRLAIQKAAQTQYQRLLKVGQNEVLAQFRQAAKGNEETATRWDAVRAWLKSPEELAAWRELARTLLRLTSPGAEDPVTELAAFLGTKQFTIEVDSITLEVPLISGIVPRAEARLVILHPASMRQPALAFEPSGRGVPDETRRVMVYTFRRAGPQRLVYRPGENLWAELNLTGGKEKLVWSTSRSIRFQFDRLRFPPRRQSSTATSLDEGRIVPGVRLNFKPEDGFPPIPDLLPRVALED